MQKVAELEVCVATQDKIASDSKADIERVLDAEVIPHLERAHHAMHELGLRDIVEVRSLLNPPLVLRRVGEALCVMFGERPDWTAFRKLFQTGIVERILEYDK